MILIAGPCVIEDFEMTYRIAKELKDDLIPYPSIDFYFKASWDKANRSKYTSYRGVGFDDGLNILSDIKYKLNIKITTDIHSVEDAETTASVVDVVQIPALLSRQTDLICAAAASAKVVNVKKGQFMNFDDDPLYICNKIVSTNQKCAYWITERGTQFGYNDLVVDFRGLKKMRRFANKVIVDVSHSSKDAEYIPILARCAIAAGADGIFVETHPRPWEAKCDGKTSLPLYAIPEILSEIYSIRKATNGKNI